MINSALFLQIMAVPLATIMEMFKDEPKIISRGENSLNSGHIINVEYDGTLKVLRGQVKASMKNLKYNVEVKLPYFLFCL